jgi:Domain of Unknown Function with PDB structure (DUF3857)/Transglutaminase-like superfamily
MKDYAVCRVVISDVTRISFSQRRMQRWSARCAVILVCVLACGLEAKAGDAPGWMHALVNAPVPAHDERTDAVLLYSERNVNVQSADKVKVTVRQAVKILRPGGREYGFVVVPFDSRKRVTSVRGWCIPAQGKDYEVKDKEAIEAALPKTAGSELITDVKAKLLHIPATDPGNIVGFEYEMEEHPFVLQDVWRFQETIPVRESHYSLQIPSGWEYRASWLNHPEVKASTAGNQLQWTISDLKEIRKEDDMPPLAGVAGQMIVSFFPPGGAGLNGFSTWEQMSAWYLNLTSGRSDASPEIKQKVAELTASAKTPLAKMRVLAWFVQHDVRYVAIELGIGGWQPHAASEIYSHRYGDCKDKATLMSSMLHEIGIDSYYVVINTERGAVTPKTPANVGFNHAILAIKLPDGVSDASLVATLQHPKLGRILFFDPTSELTPFGQIGGYLQSNYGLLAAPQGGELIELPKQPASMNRIERTAHLTLDSQGNLQGEVNETRIGDRASSMRWTLRTVTNDRDRVKPIEDVLASSLADFHVMKASVLNLTQTDEPFGFNYSFVAERYAKTAGDLLLVRPRVLGVKARGLLETKEPRRFAVEFEGPVQDTDRFQITLPTGFVVDELPPPVDADYSFASYHSKTEATGSVIAYTRTFEVKELSVPVSQSEELKKFYRIIASDERNTAVLKPAMK